VNGVKKEVVVIKDAGYDLYAFSFDASENDDLEVYYSTAGVNTLSFIDDASLYST